MTPVIEIEKRESKWEVVFSLIFGIVACWMIYMLPTPKESSIPIVYNDSPQKQKPIYKYSVTYDAVLLQSKLDSLSRFIAPNVGTSLSKDEWLATMGLYNRITSFLYSGGKVDSVLLKTK